MWMASSGVLCVLQRYGVFEVLTVTLSLWGEQGKEACHTIGPDLDLCVPFLTSDPCGISGLPQSRLLRGSVSLDHVTKHEQRSYLAN